ncbi:uncharacterized protein LOC128557587 [Mercenaria mercenaria]|uniref:uncharacterized protein LOC128557587 n=1 Tax=Mercenaria mercenaria TaxID=6596 RepID=UPI00234E9502|nr:uncharacterized protein LOC128557587 [Mercenaria mercenaria]XP_053401076.1 uncharacterized protein LOC128557587 [Mercenaria mercenaria]
MASSGGSSFCTVCLPLLLESEEEIEQDGVKEVAKDLKQHLHLFQKHILRWKDLSYVKVKDVTSDSGFIYLIFEFNSDDCLNEFYASTKISGNELSKCISAFFDEQSLKWVAGLTFNSKITCKVQMTKRDYLKAQYDMCPEDSEYPQQNSKDEQKKERKINVHYEVVKEKAEPEGTFVKERVEQYASSIKTETHRQPGSYPHEQKTKDIQTESGNSNQKKPESDVKHATLKDKHANNKKQDTEDELTPVIRKQFILYHPPVPKGWKISNIYIESETCNLLNTDLTTHYGNLFEATIDIPLKLFERQESMSFRYVVVWRKTGFVGKFVSEYYDRSKLFYVETLSCQRHLWDQINPKPTQLEIVSGYKEHLEDIMFHCTSKQDCKETCIEIENFCKTYFSKENAITILKHLADKLNDTGYRPVASLLLLITVKSLVTRQELIVNEKIVDAKNALKLLQAVQSLSISSLPTSSRRDIQSVCYQFCKVALGDTLCILTYWSTCYPFFDEKYVLERLEGYVTTNADICPDSESMFPFANELCSKLYRVAVSDSSNTAKSILEKLLRHLPLQVALHVFACLNKDNGNLSSNESDVQSVLYGSISVRVERMVIAARKSNNLTKLLTGWRDIDRFEVLTAKFKCKYEDAVIQILESHTGLLESVSDIMSGSIDQSGFFNEPSKQRQLIMAVVKSKSHEISKLFVTLAKCPTMYELYMQLEAEQFKELCVSYITGNSPYMGREFAFRYVCEHLNDIWGMPQMERRLDFQEVWENILFGEFQKYRLRELLQKLKLIDTLSRKNEHLGMVFLQFIRTNLQSNYEGFHPEEIFRWFEGTSEKPQLETRLVL